MKSRLTKHILAVLCMAVVLSALFAVTSLAAEITGGFGKIILPDDGKTYVAASVTLNEAGTGYAVNTANPIVLSNETNIDLAGLYAVSADNFATWTGVYVYGPYAERADIFENVEGKTSTKVTGTKNVFTPGKISGSESLSAMSAVTFSPDATFSNDFLKTYLGKSSDTEKKEYLWDYVTNTEKLKERYIGYTFTSREIIPVSEITKFAYSARLHATASTVTMTIKSNGYRFEAIVMDLEGNITTHTLDAARKNFPSETLDHTNSSAKFVAETMYFQDEPWSTPFPEDGYLVGFKIYPLFFMDDPAQFTITKKSNLGSTDRLRYQLKFNSYTIALPRALAPTGITVDGTTFKGLDAAKTYYVAPVLPEGYDHDKAIEVKGVTSYTLPEGTTGLYGIYFAGDGVENTDSETGAVIYVADTYENRKAIGKLDDADKPAALKKRIYDQQEWADPGTINGGYWYTSGSSSATKVFLNDSYYFTNDKGSEAATWSWYSKGGSYKVFQRGLYRVGYSYIFTTDEVSPIADVLKMKFVRAEQNGGYNVTMAGGKLVLYVMCKDGVVRTYSQTAEPHAQNRNITNSEASETFDIQTFEGLPKEGWLVAYKYFPYADVSTDDIKGASASNQYAVMARLPSTAYPDYYTLDVAKAEAPTDVTVVGNVVKNLDPNKTYAIAPYTIVGEAKDKAVQFTGVSEYSVTSLSGLMGIYVVGHDGLADSKSVLFYVYGKPSIRQEILEYVQDGSKTVLNFNASTGAFKPGIICHNVSSFTYGTNGIIGDGHFYPGHCDTLYNGIQSGDQSKIETGLAKLQERSNSLKIVYALTSEEILPISEVKKYSFSLAKDSSMGNLKFKNIQIRFDAHVMTSDGETKAYTYLIKNVNFNETETAYTVDFKNNAAWESALPTDGYFVGFVIYPFWGINSPDNVVYNGTPTQTRAIFRHIPDGYEIEVQKKDKPQGIVVEEATIRGLDPNGTYALVPYTILGATEAEEQILAGADIADGTYALDLKKHVGLWALYIPGDEYYVSSDPIFIYTYADYADRKILGEFWQEGDKNPFDSNSDIAKNWIGNLKHGSGKNSFAAGYLTHNSSFYAEHKMMADTHFSYAFVKAFFYAEDDAAKQAVVDQYRSTFNKYVYRYGLTTTEILPIKDVYSIDFTYSGGTVSTKFKFTTKNSTLRFIAHVMSEDGTITKHTMDLPYEIQKFDEKSPTSFSVDFRNASGWDIPFDANGYFVGYEYYPYYGLTSADQFEITGSVPKETDHAYRARGQAGIPTWKIKENAATPKLSTFPIMEGGYGEISGLNPEYIHQVRAFNEETGEWGEWVTAPEGITAYRVTKPGTYAIKVIDTDKYIHSNIAEIVVLVFDGNFDSYTHQISKMYLPSDFVELTAEYEIDVTVKNWVSAVALDNIKVLSPESKVVISGDGYKFVVMAEDIDISINKDHYYNMAVSFDGESRHDFDYAKLKELAGDTFYKEVFFESIGALPFKKANLMVYLDKELSGVEVELRHYNDRIDRLRIAELVVVADDGWATFTNYEMTYVIIINSTEE